MYLFISQSTFPMKQSIHIPHATSCFLTSPSPRNKKSCKLFQAKVEVRAQCFCFLQKKLPSESPTSKILLRRTLAYWPVL